jgi:hypothetical protein
VLTRPSLLQLLAVSAPSVAQGSASAGVLSPALSHAAKRAREPEAAPSEAEKPHRKTLPAFVCRVRAALLTLANLLQLA